jgi:transcriptional regulator with XRE-family HTH domain
MDKDKTFTNCLREIRKRKGLRQLDVAQMLGHTSTDRISHWENECALPGIINLFKLSIIYGTTPEHLYETLYDALGKDIQRNNGLNTIVGSNPLQVQPDTSVEKILRTTENTL